MELTDEQLHILLSCDLWTRQTTPTLGICEELERLNLLMYNGTGHWKLTTLGYKVLEKNRVRALYVLPFHHTEAAMATVRRHFGNLPLYDLASLLTHRSALIRAYAKERMKELTGGTDR